MRRLRKVSLLIWLPVLIVIGYQDSTYAVNGTLKQQILPLDCVYQIVNDGTGTVVYLTPSECGVLPTPTINTPQVVTIVDSGTAIFQVPFIPVVNTRGDTEETQPAAAVEGAEFVPYTQLTTVANKGQTTLSANESGAGIYIPPPIAIMGVSALLLLLLLVFL